MRRFLFSILLLITMMVACSPAPSPTAPPATTVPMVAATRVAPTATAPSVPTPVPTVPVSTLAPTTVPQSPTPTTSTQRGPSKGELRFSDGFLTPSLDADSGTAGFRLLSYGVAETLMRLTPQLKVEPWLASKMESVDPFTWRITLRDDVTFWDGTKMDAAAVKASLQRSMDKQPGTVNLLPKETHITAEGQVITLKLPVAMGLLPNNLAAYNFAIKKVGADGKLIYTGPFMTSEFVQGSSLTLTAYPGYRGGPAGIQTVRVRLIADSNARALALQAGDIDFAIDLLPASVEPLKKAGVTVMTFPAVRQHFVILNVTRAPLDDVNVRRAIALATDRESLVKGVMDGLGSAAFALVPENLGLPGIERIQKYDPDEAKRVLDAAGWLVGADGIRVKDGKRLTFKLSSYAGRSELEPLTIAMRDQLKAVGIDATLDKITDITTAVATSAFDATIYSLNTVPSGDAADILRLLYVASDNNKNRYLNPRLEDLFKQYTQNPDPAKRQDLLHQMQGLIADDVPMVFLVNTYQVNGLSPKIKNYTPHPLDNYRLTPDMTID